MIGRAPRACASHRAALLDFVDRHEQTPQTRLALAHLERCTACEDELAGIVRTIAALSRLRQAASREEPRPGAWSTLHDQLLRPSPAPAPWRLSLGGLMVSAIVVALLSNRWIGAATNPVPAVSDGVVAGVAVVERRYDPPARPRSQSAIVGAEVSGRARVRSTELHVEPTSVDRSERDRVLSAVLSYQKPEGTFAVASPRSR